MHSPAIAEKRPEFNQGDRYYGNMEFVCPVCGRSGKFFLKLLGNRYITCNGEAFSKVYDQDAYQGCLK